MSCMLSVLWMSATQLISQCHEAWFMKHGACMMLRIAKLAHVVLVTHEFHVEQAVANGKHAVF